MNERELVEFLQENIEELLREESGERVRTRTFGESGLMTNNEGLVVRVGGREFQITVVCSS